MLGEEFAARTNAMLAESRSGGYPGRDVWTPDPARAIEAVVLKKTRKYASLPRSSAARLVLHNSAELRGWYDQSVEGHAYFAARCDDVLRGSPFELVILESTFVRAEQWSVLYRAGGDD